MAKVIIRNAAYQYDQLRPIIFEILEKLMGGRIKTGSRVLIKPNMLCSARPEDAVLTHPHLIRAVCGVCAAARRPAADFGFSGHRFF